MREDHVYRRLFGANTGGIYTLNEEIFAAFGLAEVEPRWLTHGVIKIPPNEARATWIYVTSGLSNAWSDAKPNPFDWSGLGYEFVLETAEDFPWALFHIRRLLAYQILLGWAQLEGREMLAIGDVVAMGSPIDGANSQLTSFLVAPASGYPSEFQIPSGKAEFLHLVGVTGDEADFARTHGHEELLARLAPTGYPVTDPARQSVLAGDA